MLIVFFVISIIASMKRFSTDPCITEISEALDSYPVLAANATLERSCHLLPTCRHHLRLGPRGRVKLLFEIITLPLSKHIKLLNVTWLSSVFCGIIIIFIQFFLLSFHYLFIITSAQLLPPDVLIFNRLPLFLYRNS